MKIFKLIILILITVSLNNSSSIAQLSGTVEKETIINRSITNTVVDSATGKAVPDAIVSIPSQGVSTRTNQNGRFSITGNFGSPAILSVKAEGYKPFSMTVSKSSLSKPLVLGISKQTGKEIIIDSNLHHLGDGNYSEYSANAGDFQSRPSGPVFSKQFYVENFDKNKDIVLRIGSVIGIDTEIAKRLNQNRITNSVSSPTNIYLNSQKIGELRINGDNQTIVIYPQDLIPNSYNQVSLQTGKNLNSYRRVDFDDMEFMNLILEFR